MSTSQPSAGWADLLNAVSGVWSVASLYNHRNGSRPDLETGGQALVLIQVRPQIDDTRQIVS